MPQAGLDIEWGPSLGGLEAKAELLELLFQATSDGVVDWDLVANRTSYNDRWRFLLGWDDDELVLKRDTWRDLIHMDEQAQVEKAITDHLEQGWPFVQTVRMRHRIMGWRWIMMRGAARRNSQGDAVRMVITFADVDERVRAESEIRALVQAIPDTILRVRSDGTVLALKEGNLLEDTSQPSETTHHGPFDAIRASESGPLLMEAIRSAGEKREAAHVTCRARTAAGEFAEYDVRIVSSGPDEAVCIVRDVTREKSIEEQIARGRKLEAIGELAGGLAHEMNTPLQYTNDSLYFVQDTVPQLLNLIDGYRGLLRQGGSSPAAVAAITDQEETLDLPLTRESLTRALARCQKGLGQIDRLVRAMKTFQNVGRQGSAWQELNPIVENATIVATHAWDSAAELSLRLGQNLPLVSCWAGEVAQVVVGLLNNATQAIRDKFGDSGKKGKIVVETLHNRESQAVEIRVTDDGVGILDAIREKVFDPFFTTRPVGQGSGQGLAQIHATVRQHGGSVRFDTHVGEGTCFVVTLPVRPGNHEGTKP